MSRLLRAVSVVVVALAMLGATGATVLWLREGGTSTATGPRDLDGRAVALDDAPGDAVRGRAAGRFEAPRQGLDVPLVELAVTGTELVPPTFTDAFLVDGPADADAAGERPVVVAMHALREGRAPGNAFFEDGAADPAVTVRAGDPLVVDGVAYTVTRTEVLAKSAAARSADVWAAQPGGSERLVVITCLQRAGASGPAAENLLVHAART